MYDVRFARKVIQEYISYRRTPARIIMAALHKSEHDLVYLFQNSQVGWRLFKKLASSCDLTSFWQQEGDMEFFNWQALNEICSKPVMDMVLNPDKYGLCDSEHVYLTKFYQGFIL